jgi:hypothetical protein
LLGVASRTLLLLGTLAVVAAAFFSWRLAAPVVGRARAAMAELYANASPLERWLWLGALALQAIAWIFAAHPQRLYDQLNYHLVVGDLIVRQGQPFYALDAHVSFAGVIEYAFAFHRAWTDSRLAFVALAQVAVMAVTIPLLIGCCLRLGRGSLGLFAVLGLALPGLIPETFMLRMAKPDGIALTAAVVLLALLVDAPAGWRHAAIALSAMFIACKLTFVHAIIGLTAAWAVARPPSGKRREWLPLVAVGLACAALQFGKNALLFENPLYPMAATIFPSPASDEATSVLWRLVAFENNSRFTGWLGPILVGRDGAALLLLVLVAASFALWSRWRGLPQSSSADDARRSATVGAFLLAFWVVWPLFYGGTIAPRFTGPFWGGLLVLFVLLFARVNDLVQKKRLLVVCATIALFSSQLDRSVPGLVRANLTSAEEAFAQQWPRLRTAALLNSRTRPLDTVIADRPEKLFFDARLLMHDPLSPRERAMLEDLRQSPLAAAERYRVAALVVDTTHAPAPMLTELWKRLAAHGHVLHVGPDRILVSPCYFRSPCGNRD